MTLLGFLKMTYICLVVGESLVHMYMALALTLAFSPDTLIDQIGVFDKIESCAESVRTWMFQNKLKLKKTTYALKTPRVVALPFIYGVEYIIISNQKKGEIVIC